MGYMLHVAHTLGIHNLKIRRARFVGLISMIMDRVGLTQIYM